MELTSRVRAESGLIEVAFRNCTRAVKSGENAKRPGSLFASAQPQGHAVDWRLLPPDEGQSQSRWTFTPASISWPYRLSSTIRTSPPAAPSTPGAALAEDRLNPGAKADLVKVREAAEKPDPALDKALPSAVRTIPASCVPTTASASVVSLPSGTSSSAWPPLPSRPHANSSTP